VTGRLVHTAARSRALFCALLFSIAHARCIAQGTSWSIGLAGAAGVGHIFAPASLGLTIAHDLVRDSASSLRLEATALKPLIASHQRSCVALGTCQYELFVTQLATLSASWVFGGRPQVAPRGWYGMLSVGEYFANGAEFPGGYGVVISASGVVISSGFGVEIGGRTSPWRAEVAVRYLGGGFVSGHVLPVLSLSRAW
jgi:hypothetical protein